MRGEYEDIADMDLPKVNSSSAVKSSYFSKFKVASCILMLVLLVASLNFFLIDEEHRPLPPRWNNQRLVEVSRSTFGFQNGDDHEVLKACYDPNGTISTPLNPSGVIRGVNNILHHIVNTRSFASDASFVPMTTGISTHTANKDTNAIVAATGKYVHTGLDPLGTKQCEVETPMHIFQEVDDDYKIVNEWQHVNYSHFIHNIRRCNSLNLPLGPKFAQDVITKVFPDVIEYGWNGTELINLANRFWSDLNLNAEMAKESVTVDIQDAVKKLADIMQEAGISTTPVAPNYPSIVVDGHSEEYSTISVLVAQEIVGISVKTGSKCSFRMQWIHAYIIQRHYRIAGFVTAGNSNEFNTSIRDCNKFGSQEYGYSNWHQQQQATKTIMDDLKRNRILEKLLSGRASIAVVNNTVVATAAERPERFHSFHPTVSPTAIPDIAKRHADGNEQKECLCTSNTGCALPGALPCCDGLYCSGDAHHSQCEPKDTRDYKKNHQCVITNKYGCNLNHRDCCNAEAKCTDRSKDHGVCRLECELGK